MNKYLSDLSETKDNLIEAQRQADSYYKMAQDLEKERNLYYKDAKVDSRKMNEMERKILELENPDAEVIETPLPKEVRAPQAQVKKEEREVPPPPPQPRNQKKISINEQKGVLNHLKDSVKITVSSTLSGTHLNVFTQGGDDYWLSKNEQNSFICFELCGKVLRPDGYYLLFNDISLATPCSWRFEASVNQQDWISIHEQLFNSCFSYKDPEVVAKAESQQKEVTPEAENEYALIKIEKGKTIRVEQTFACHSENFYKFFRFVQIRKNNWSTHCFRIEYVELTGTIGD